MLNVAIYARKSIFSDKSDSIDVQIKLCKEYVSSHYTDYKFLVYGEDEGYTGANTDRPSFKKMLSDIEQGGINIVVCYKIDRISRDVKDFSNSFDFMQQHNVSFVSVKEQIDTSTPLGRAMMYICSVFAQMERETIAERVKDNMSSLAQTGKWAGGRAPLGYKGERTTVNGKEHTVLVPDPDRIPFLEKIFDTFLEGYSLNGMETKFRDDGVKSINNKYLSSSQLHLILCNPHVVQNAPEVWDYFKEKGCKMMENRENFDGKHGVIVYGRTQGGKTKKHALNPPEKWMVCSGLHKPIISSEKWLKVQARFGINSMNKTRKHKIGILKGVLRCGSCGRLMIPKYKHDKKYDIEYKHYYCPSRMRMGKEYCPVGMVPICDLDNKVVELIKELALDKSTIQQFLKESIVKSPAARTKKMVKGDISRTQGKLETLAAALADNSSSAAAKYIIAEIEKLDASLLNLESELREIQLKEAQENKENETIDSLYKTISQLSGEIDNMEYDEINKIMNELISDCTWDGETLYIKF